MNDSAYHNLRASWNAGGILRYLWYGLGLGLRNEFYGNEDDSSIDYNNINKRKKKNLKKKIRKQLKKYTKLNEIKKYECCICMIKYNNIEYIKCNTCKNGYCCSGCTRQFHRVNGRHMDSCPMCRSIIKFT